MLIVHYVFLAALVAVFAAQALKRLGLDGTTVMIVGAIVLGALVAFAVARTKLAATFMTVLAAAPIVFLCVFLFNSSVTDLVFPDGHRGAARQRPGLDAGRLAPLRRVPGHLDHGRERRDRREALPELRPARRALDLVQEHDHLLGVDDGRGALDADREGPGQAQAPALPELPQEPVHAARPRLRDERDRVADAPVPAAALRPRGRGHDRAALRALLRRAGRLPPPALTAGTRRPAAVDRRVVGRLRQVGRARYGRQPLRRHRGEAVGRGKSTFWVGRVRDFNSSSTR